MTKNRTEKLAARGIAAEQDVRLPEAAYRDDRRKLRLPDGSVYNFADGALQPPTENEDAHRLWVAHVMREAASKGWRLFRHGGHTADEAPAALAAFRTAGPALILIDSTYWVELEGKAYEEMARSGPQSLNILISYLPYGCSVAPSPWKSVHTPLDVGRRALRRESVPTVAPEVALLKARITFARRYADMEALGVNPADILDGLAEDMGGLSTETGNAMAAALRDVASGTRKGMRGEELWLPHREVLGMHIVRMAISGELMGHRGRGLRMAADTLESELRIGIDA